MSSQHKVIEWLCGRQGAVERVEVEFERPTHGDAYEEYFQCPVLFGQDRNALIIKSDALSWPLLQHDKNAFLNLQGICEERLAKATKDRSLSEKVMDEISPLLEGQTPSIEQVADSLGMPSWTLRRKLQDHGTSFQNLLNDVPWSCSLRLSVHEGMPKLSGICEERLAKATKDRSLSEKVMDEISPLLEGQTPSIEQVADSLGMPSWTLRRKLQDHGTSFQNLLNDTRRSLAESYMKDTDLAIGEIAYLLGFSSPTAFQRAFKRWTDESPGVYRRLHREQTHVS